jgi:hypothetical protein
MRPSAWSPTLALAVLALLPVSSAGAGGAPTELYFVRNEGGATVIRLTQKTGDALYGGPAAAAPSGEYVQVFPSFFGLPGLPLRYFPEERVLCGRPPDPSCRHATRSARRTLSAAVKDGLRSTEKPTVITSMTYRGEPVERPNAWIGIELALAQDSRSSPPPSRGIPVELRWRGPAAEARPERALLAEDAVTADGKTFDLLPGVARYLAENLPLPEAVPTALSASSKGSEESDPRLWPAVAIAASVTALLVSLALAAVRRARLR